MTEEMRVRLQSHAVMLRRWADDLYLKEDWSEGDFLVRVADDIEPAIQPAPRARTQDV